MPPVSSASAAAYIDEKRSAAAASKSACRYRKLSCNWPSAVTAPTDMPRGMCAELENAMRTGPRYPDQGGSATLPRLVSIDVSHTIRPTARSANRTASLFSATGHQPGARSETPAEARSGRTRLMALV